MTSEKQQKRQKLLTPFGGTLLTLEPVNSTYILLQPEWKGPPIASTHQRQFSCTVPCLPYGQLSKLKSAGYVSGREQTILTLHNLQRQSLGKQSLCVALPGCQWRGGSKF